MLNKQENWLARGAGRLSGKRATVSRSFALCSLALATVALASSMLLLTGCGDDETTYEYLEIGTPDPIEVPEENVTLVTSEYEETEANVEKTVEYTLPAGTQAWVNSDAVAALFIPTQDAQSLFKAEILELKTGERHEVLPAAQGVDEGYAIYDVRCTESVIVWVEVCEAIEQWALYYAKVTSDYEISDITQIASESTRDYDPPEIAVYDDAALWTVMPSEDGTKTEENSYLYKRRVGNGESTTMFCSPGRMLIAPKVSQGIITIVPRVDDDSIYYSLVAIDADNDTIVKRMDLPSGMKVSDACYLNGRFVFSIDASYNYGDGISYYGTYIETGDNTFVRFDRMAYDTAVAIGDYIVVKSTLATLWVNTADKSFFTVDAPEGCASYGDYIASEGVHSRVVTFATIDAETSNDEASVLLRIFKVKE